MGIFSQSVDYHFVLLIMSFVLQKLFGLRRSHLLIVALSVCATWVTSGKWSPVKSFKYTSQLSSVCFSVVGFILRVLTYLDLSFVHGIRYKSVFIFLHVKAAPFV